MRDPRVAQAVRLMEENIEQPIVLTRLARRVGISARHLQGLFQAEHRRPAARPLSGTAAERRAAEGDRDQGAFRRYRGRDRLQFGFSFYQKLSRQFL